MILHMSLWVAVVIVVAGNAVVEKPFLGCFSQGQRWARHHPDLSQKWRQLIETQQVKWMNGCNWLSATERRDITIDNGNVKPRTMMLNDEMLCDYCKWRLTQLIMGNNENHGLNVVVSWNIRTTVSTQSNRMFLVEWPFVAFYFISFH